VIRPAPTDVWESLLTTPGSFTEGVIPVKHAVTTSRVRSRILKHGVTPDELSRLSASFIDERLECWGSLYQPNETLPDLELAFAPVAEAYVGYGSGARHPVLLITLGMYELLRYHCVVSIWSSWAQTLVTRCDPAQSRDLSLVRGYLNLCSVLFLCEIGTLPRIEAEIGKNQLDNGHRLAESTLLYLILHEMGHIAWERMSGTERHAFAAELNAKGLADVSEHHVKEHFCDVSVFNHVPEDARGAMIIASQALLNISNYCEAHNLLRHQASHPPASQRIRAMQLWSGCSNHWKRSIDRIVDSAESIRRLPEGSTEKYTVDSLRDLRERLELGFPWQVTFARLQAISAEQDHAL
jgi:hypothetical protein